MSFEKVQSEMQRFWVLNAIISSIVKENRHAEMNVELWNRKRTFQSKFVFHNPRKTSSGRLALHEEWKFVAAEFERWILRFNSRCLIFKTEATLSPGNSRRFVGTYSFSCELRRRPFPIFFFFVLFFALFFSFLFALLFSLSSATHMFSVACKKLDVNNG